ncbi:alpha-L-rhamnosidase C-terminal domain-containing protein [Microbacterium atlanticum]|uniref:alpha-L-rhamnosidase C-terminal domain-containing protein n=1 Tax=Microbacterium atlanticum TaxID=2782168 RepID=UPI003B5871F6
MIPHPPIIHHATDSTSAEGVVETLYGRASSSLGLDDDSCKVRIEVPVSTRCTVTLPDGASHDVASRVHDFTCVGRRTATEPVAS